ncbi:endonuclease/exonuclease/phosphatase family protein, partial [Bordetella pertussis]|uniref:endonuclease/exonuclease/phosphatase family protein n=1 Tax=Bordetella pertussis TaxID=520 RepID=UPI000A8D9773
MPPEPIRLRILTVNAHKGFTSFNRRFILHELREALREARPDLVFLQEVLGEHQRHAARHARWPAVSQYEFLADTLWSAYAYGRNAVYPDGHHGNAVLSKYPIVSHRNEDLSVGAGLREAHRQEQLRRLCQYLRQHVPAQAAALL